MRAGERLINADESQLSYLLFFLINSGFQVGADDLRTISAWYQVCAAADPSLSI